MDKIKEKNSLFKIEVIADFQTLTKNVMLNFKKLINAKRNFVIKRRKNID